MRIIETQYQHEREGYYLIHEHQKLKVHKRYYVESWDDGGWQGYTFCEISGIGIEFLCPCSLSIDVMRDIVEVQENFNLYFTEVVGCSPEEYLEIHMNNLRDNGPSVEAWIEHDKELNAKYEDDDEYYYFFFDTETTGLPIIWNAPADNVHNWPRIVQVAYVIYDRYGTEICGQEFVIKPDGFHIPLEASNVHGITTQKATQIGLPLNYVLNELYDKIRKSKYLVAHNLSFDEKVLGAEFIRNGMRNLIEDKDRICTMMVSTEYCALLPIKNGEYKYPSLSQLYSKLFGTNLKESHNAAVDIRATVECFWRMKDLGIIN